MEKLEIKIVNSTIFFFSVYREKVNKDGSCPHPYLVKKKNSDICILPSRIDMFLHYAKTGGRYGAKVRNLGFL